MEETEQNLRLYYPACCKYDIVISKKDWEKLDPDTLKDPLEIFNYMNFCGFQDSVKSLVIQTINEYIHG